MRSRTSAATLSLGHSWIVMMSRSSRNEGVDCAGSTYTAKEVDYRRKLQDGCGAFYYYTKLGDAVDQAKILDTDPDSVPDLNTLDPTDPLLDCIDTNAADMQAEIIRCNQRRFWEENLAPMRGQLHLFRGEGSGRRSGDKCRHRD